MERGWNQNLRHNSFGINSKKVKEIKYTSGWKRSLRDETEALSTLQDESVYFEAALLESRTDREYVSFHMEAEDLEAAGEAFGASTHDIDRQFKRLLSEVTAQGQPDEDIESLYDLVNPDRP